MGLKLISTAIDPDGHAVRRGGGGLELRMIDGKH
jgi:hypothetical protein